MHGKDILPEQGDLGDGGDPLVPLVGESMGVGSVEELASVDPDAAVAVLISPRDRTLRGRLEDGSAPEPSPLSFSLPDGCAGVLAG